MAAGIRFRKVLGILGFGFLLVLLSIAFMIGTFLKTLSSHRDEGKRIDALPRLSVVIHGSEALGFPFTDPEAVMGQIAAEGYTPSISFSPRSASSTERVIRTIIPESILMEYEGKVYPLAAAEITHFSGYRTGETLIISRDDTEEERLRWRDAYRGLDPELDKMLEALSDPEDRLQRITISTLFFRNGDRAEMAGRIEDDVIRSLD